MIKVKKRKILLLPGDGIGPEVIGEVKKVINWFNDIFTHENFKKRNHNINIIIKLYLYEFFL